ncbi:hypothetical protein HYV12_00910 [Candidatus Dojkabacteria bacterium]|nr:hypothetical protein [Candidatus Dojkabacteria bacterium]
MKTLFTILRVILVIPFFILLALVLILSPFVISLKYTVFNSEYLKETITDQRTLKLIEDNLYSEQAEGSKELQELIFKDSAFLTNTLNAGIDNIFVWLERDSEEITITADRQTAKDKYLSVLYTKIEEEIKREFKIDIDASKVPVCKNTNLSTDELKVRLIDGKPCFPMDFEKAVDEGFSQLGISSQGDKVTLLTVPREKLSKMEMIQNVYWVIDNSIILTITSLILLTLAIIIISPKRKVGYILTGVFIFFISLGNFAIFSLIPRTKIQDILNLINMQRTEITEEIIQKAYDGVISFIVIDMSNIGRSVSLAFFITAVVIFASVIILNVVKKRGSVVVPAVKEVKVA